MNKRSIKEIHQCDPHLRNLEIKSFLKQRLKSFSEGFNLSEEFYKESVNSASFSLCVWRCWVYLDNESAAHPVIHYRHTVWSMQYHR